MSAGNCRHDLEGGISVQDQYLELTSAVPKEAALYGIGEHISTSGLLLRREGAPLTLWNRDNAASEPDQNTYGSWPFLLDVRPGVHPQSLLADQCPACTFSYLDPLQIGSLVIV